jgi:hypothetical protein
MLLLIVVLKLPRTNPSEPPKSSVPPLMVGVIAVVPRMVPEPVPLPTVRVKLFSE